MLNEIKVSSKTPLSVIENSFEFILSCVWHTCISFLLMEIRTSVEFLDILYSASAHDIMIYVLYRPLFSVK